MSELGRAAAGDAAQEIEELAALLAEVVQLAGNRAVFPGRWAHIAELAMGHHSVRRAVRAAGGGS
jgi:hypothetical protein